MPRGLSTAQLAALNSTTVRLAILCELQFLNYTVYVWSGLGPFVYNGNTYTGVGILGKISPIQESNQVLATGVSVTLSGIAQGDLDIPEIQANISLENQVTLSMVLLDTDLSIIGGTAITSFTGLMGELTVNETPSGSTITIDIESKLAQLNRPKYWTYCLTDMNFWNPGDKSFSWTTFLADYTFRFGN